MECGIGQSGQVAELMTEYGFSDLSFLRDTQDIPRVVAGTLGKKKENQDG